MVAPMEFLRRINLVPIMCVILFLGWSEARITASYAQENNLRDIAWNPMEQTVAVGDALGHIYIRDVASGELLRTIDAHQTPVIAIAWYSDSSKSWLASAGLNHVIRIHDANTGTLIREFTYASSRDINDLLWIQNGTRLLSSSSSDDTGSVTIMWDAATGEVVATAEGDTGDLSWDPVHDRIALARGNGVWLRDDTSLDELKVLQWPEQAEVGFYPTHVAWHPSGQWLATGYVNGAVSIWSANNNSFSFIAPGLNINGANDFSTLILDVGFSTDGSRLITVRSNGELTIWDWTQSKILSRSNLPITEWTNHLALSPDASQVAFVNKTISHMDIVSIPTVYNCTIDGIADASALLSALRTANATNAPASSTICLQSNSTITLNAVEITNASFGDILLPEIKKDITIVGNGSTIQRDANGPDGRFTRILSTGKLTLDGLTLSGGKASGTSLGGAVRLDSGTLVIKNSSTLSGNNASKGGAIFNYQGTVQIENSVLSGNSAAQDGGAIYGLGTFTLTNVDVTQNTAGNNGGGFHLYSVSPVFSQVTLTDVDIISNTATLNGGGLLFTDGGTLTLNRGHITTNSAVNFGGGLYIQAGTTTVTNTVFEANHATNATSRGGAIFSSGSTTALTTTGAVFTNNTALTRGGAIYNASGDISVTGGVFTGNMATDAGSDGGAIFSANASASITITEVRFTSNAALDQGGALAQSGGTGSMTGSCLVSNSATNGAAVWSSNAYPATNNWWNNLTPAVTSNVTTSPLTPGTTCPLN